MDEEIISNYFVKMNQMYDLKTAVGVEVYINLYIYKYVCHKHLSRAERKKLSDDNIG